MRLFISINFPAELHPYCKALQKEFPGLKEAHEFHLTLQFLGDDIPEERVPAIIDKLSTIQFKPFEITLGDAVTFGDPKHLRGIWIECRGGSSLHGLADQIRKVMGNLGFLDEKPFRAHLTLGRYKKNPPALPKRIPGKPHSFVIDQFHLMQSHLSPEGPRHKILETFPASS